MAGITEDSPGDILILGMGTGTFAKYCSEYFPDCSIEGVEIDQKIAALAREYFELPDSVQVTVGDGRSFLAASDKKYNVIMVDAYQDITIPFQMSSVEFFTLVKEHLNENGVMVVNMNMHSDAEGNINDYLSDTIAEVFDYVYTVEVRGSTNRELFATQNPDVLSDFEAVRETIEDTELQMMLTRVSDGITLYEKGEYLLTDDKAPVELLGMQVIDALIQEELSYYKDLFKLKGIRGFLEDI